MTDWFRKTSWTQEDQKDFWTRHHRARGDYNKEQYLRIQASHLAETRKPALAAAAMQLLDLMITEFPEPSQLSCAQLQRGDIYLERGQLDDALVAYRAAIAQE